jgi:predicted enzyme related to lactoylglutathione lyase
MPNRVVWFDIPAVDLDRASKFYAAVLGCQVTQDQPGVAAIEHAGSDVSGCIYVDEQDKPAATGALLYFNCNGRLDAAIAQVEALGGKILKSKHTIGPYGQRAIVLDSEGNRIALHSE